MRKALPRADVLFVAIIGISLAMIAVGCYEGSEDEGQTAVTKKGAAVGEPTAGERGAEQRTGRGEQEVARKQRQSERETPREGRPSDGRNGEQAIVVRVTGTEGLSFVGRIASAQELKRIEGSVPEEYNLQTEPGAVAVSIRKQRRGAGTLGVEVIRGGRVVASKKTSNPMGMVNLVWSSSRKSERKEGE